MHPLPAPARAIAGAVTDAVAAARDADAGALEEAAARLAVLEREQVGVVLGAVVRSLLEEAHPDGLSEGDARDVLERCVRSAAGWLPGLDGQVLVLVLTGALGVHEPGVSEAEEASRQVSALDVARHAPLLVAHLLAASRRPLTGYLQRAFAEIARAETMEMP